MKILYIGTNVDKPPFEPLVDYQNDCLLIGLKELFGDDVVDASRRDHLYKDFPDDLLAKQYGKGFTVCKTLEPDNTDRTDIEQKIRNKFFDLVVYGSVSRCTDYLELVKEKYNNNQIVMVDGDDRTQMNPLIKMETIYMKRELVWEDNLQFEKHFGSVAPISFAFPTSKVLGALPKKQRYAVNDPRKPNSYIFTDEASYYNDYRVSKYAFTMKKAGWDCLRHYEIIANGCLPLFDNVANIPRYIMMKFPKALVTKIIFFAANKNFEYLDENYDYLSNELMEHFMKHNTTKAMANNFIYNIKRFQR
jgi:hypothetical protein